MFWTSAAVRGPNTNLREAAPQTQNGRKAPHVFVVWILELSVTLTSDCQPVFVRAWCVCRTSAALLYMYVCSSSSSSSSSSSCPYIWIDSFCVCVPGPDPTAAFGAEFRLFLPEAFFPLAELDISGKLPSCLSLFIGRQQREQTGTKCHSQPEREPRGRAQSEGEEQGGGRVCVCGNYWCFYQSQSWRIQTVRLQESFMTCSWAGVVISSPRPCSRPTDQHPAAGILQLLLQDYFNTSSCTCNWVKVQ